MPRLRRDSLLRGHRGLTVVNALFAASILVWIACGPTVSSTEEGKTVSVSAPAPAPAVETDAHCADLGEAVEKWRGGIGSTSIVLVIDATGSSEAWLGYEKRLACLLLASLGLPDKLHIIVHGEGIRYFHISSSRTESQLIADIEALEPKGTESMVDALALGSAIATFYSPARLLVVGDAADAPQTVIATAKRVGELRVDADFIAVGLSNRHLLRRAAEEANARFWVFERHRAIVEAIPRILAGEFTALD